MLVKTITRFLSVLMLLFSSQLWAQESHNTAVEAIRHHRLALTMGNTHILEGRNNGGELIIPSWGLDYEYWFTERLALGFHGELEIQSYVLDRGEENATLEREYPLVGALVLLYSPWKKLLLYGGPGLEVERNENFAFYRLGAAYEIELPHHWDLTPTLFYDKKTDLFDAWSIGLAIGRKF
ncbi:MAG: hypothetical protein H6555_11305 [Lewinellaceae bacterium]|nr:hypothetical protein [Lewinellaceae bacterium]